MYLQEWLESACFDRRIVASNEYLNIRLTGRLGVGRGLEHLNDGLVEDLSEGLEPVGDPTSMLGWCTTGVK